MRRFFKALILFIVGGAVVALAVANRHPVRFVVDPFINRDQAYSFEAPLYVYLFLAMFTGILIGAFVMWIGQGHWRKTARTERKEAALWKREAENLKRGLQAVSGAQSAAPQPKPLRSYI